MKKIFVFSLGIALNTTGLSASEKLYETSNLPGNNLQIVAIESHKVPLATIVLACRAGAKTETPDINGLTHLWEHMFFKGNARLPDQEAFNQRVRQLGIQFNGDTSAELVRYYFTLPSAFLDEGVQFMADAIATPLLEQKEMEKERKVVLDEYDRAASNPAFDRYRLARRLFYGKFDYARDPLGVRTIIESANRDQLLRIKEQVFVPANCSLLVGGDVEHKSVVASATKHFANWSTPKGWKPVQPVTFSPITKSSEFVMTRPHVENAVVMIQLIGPKASTEPKDSFAADILISLLQQKSGKFYKKFVDSGLCFSAGLSYHTQSQAGELMMYAETKPENAEKVRKMLIEAPKEWTSPSYFGKNQLSDVRRELLIDHKRELNSTSAFTKTLAFWWGVTGLDYYDSYLSNLSKTEIPEVTSFAKRYLVNRPYVSSILVSPTDAKTVSLNDNSKDLMKSVGF